MRGVFAIVLLAAAVGAAAWHRASAIEVALAAAAEAAASAVGGSGVEVVAEGLDIVVAGAVASADLAARVERAVATVPGVRTVDSRLTVGDSAKPAVDGEGAGSRGAAVVSWDSCRHGLDTVLTRGRIDFESGSSELAPASIPLLDELAVILDQCGDPRIEIAGHTDASGPRTENLDLSQRRAEAVRAYLLAAGVAAERLSAVGYGPDEPVAENATRAGRARNRRIELRVLDR